MERDFLDEKKGWAAFGYIFRTEDGGNTWQDQKVSKEVSVGGLSFLDKTTGWAVGKDGQIWKTRDGGKVWKMKSGYRPFVYFLDSKTAWGILRNHKSKKPGIAKTEDGGNTWKVQKTFDNDVNIRFFFVNATTGWAVGEEWGFDRSGSKLLNRFILNTNDGGKTWVTQFKDVAGEKWGVGDGLFDVFFIDQNEGWVVGSKDLILHTKDGGRHWANQNSGTKSDLWKVQFIDAKRGWAIGNKVVEGSGTSIILHTEDGGEHWYVQWKKKTDWMWLHQLQFIDENNGWVTGDINEYSGDRILLQTTNGGKTWTKREFRDIYFIQIFFIDKERGVILTEKDQMLITKDGGKTWDKQRIPIRRYPWHVSEVFKEK